MEPSVASDVVWSLEDLYRGKDDPNLETDKGWCVDQVKAFSSRHKGHIAGLAPPELLACVQHYERILERSQKLHSFAYLFFSTQTHNPDASALWQSAQEFTATIRRDTLFFELEWNQVDEDRARQLMAASPLDHYHHFLESLRRYKPHLLSEPEEKILAEKEPVGTSAWSTLHDKVLSQLRFGERKRTQAEVLSELYSPERETRRQAALELTRGLEEVLHILGHIFNVTLLDKAIDDRLRGYPHWLKSRNLANEADDRMVEALVRAVCSRFDLVQRYYRLKRRLLGLEELYDYDRYAPLPEITSPSLGWEEAKRLVLAGYERFSPAMAEIATRFFDHQWIHAPVMAGKRSGAFSHPAVPSGHPYVFLNYTGKHRDVMTLAHELGHGVHQYLARKQGLFNSETPLTTAETASVFGEMLVFQHLLDEMGSPRERLSLLCGKLEDIFATIFRQISMNRFEEAVHTERRIQGELGLERFSEIWMATQQEMFGDSVELLSHYRVWWSYIQHFVHWPGYVYAYAFGELMVLALVKKYEETGPPFVPLYHQLLESGGRESPDALLRPLGIDLAQPGFWSLGLEALEKMLQEAERLSDTVG